MLLFVYRQRLLNAEARLADTWCRIHIQRRHVPDHWQHELDRLAFHCRQAFDRLHTAEQRALEALKADSAKDPTP